MLPGTSSRLSLNVLLQVGVYGVAGVVLPGTSSRLSLNEPTITDYLVNVAGVAGDEFPALIERRTPTIR